MHTFNFDIVNGQQSTLTNPETKELHLKCQQNNVENQIEKTVKIAPRLGIQALAKTGCYPRQSIESDPLRTT